MMTRKFVVRVPEELFEKLVDMKIELYKKNKIKKETFAELMKYLVDGVENSASQENSVILSEHI